MENKKRKIAEDDDASPSVPARIVTDETWDLAEDGTLTIVLPVVTMKPGRALRLLVCWDGIFGCVPSTQGTVTRLRDADAPSVAWDMATDGTKSIVLCGVYLDEFEVINARDSLPSLMHTSVYKNGRGTRAIAPTTRIWCMGIIDTKYHADYAVHVFEHFNKHRTIADVSDLLGSAYGIRIVRPRE